MNIFKRLFQVKKEKVYYMNKKDLIIVKPKIDCNLLTINEYNYSKVLDMRDKNIVNSFYHMLMDEQIGVFAESKDSIISHAWLQIGGKSKTNFNNSFGKLRNNEGLIHFCNTDSKYRGNNIYPYLISNLADIYFKLYPHKRLYITTSPDNLASQKGLKKVGFKYLEDRNIFKIIKYIRFTMTTNKR